jgi:hypothetical protein
MLHFHGDFLPSIARMDAALVVARFRQCPQSFYCVVDAALRLHGYFIVLPINADAVAALRAGRIAAGRHIDETHLACSGSAAAAVYLSVVCATGARAQAAAVRGAIDVVRRFHRVNGARFLFARAATIAGARMLQRLTNRTFLPDGRIHEIELADYPDMHSS